MPLAAAAPDDDDDAEMSLLLAEYISAWEKGKNAPDFDQTLSPKQEGRIERLRQFWAQLKSGGLTLGDMPRLPKIDDATGLPSRVGRFVIRRVLGAGGCGTVYLAHDPSLNREVALKVPRVEMMLSPDARARFQAEATITAELDHPHVVPVYEADQAEGVYFIASKFCGGGSLADWLGRHEKADPRLAARITAALCDGLHVAHGRNIIHRDLKPGNVMLDTREGGDWLADLGVPMLGDFGLARQANGADFASGAVVGTPAYMAPEQALGRTREVGPLSDVYGMGAILYDLLTGRPPFQGETWMVTVQMVVTDEPQPPRSLSPRVPRDLETICLKCLSKEQAKRYASAAELAADLRRWLAGEPILARPVGWMERGWMWCRREPRLAAASLVALLALAALPSLAMWLLGREANERVRREGAETLAASREFFNGMLRLGGRRREGAGWTWAALDDVKRLAASPFAADSLPELRGEAVAALTQPDLRYRGSLLKGFPGSFVEFHPDGRLAVTKAISPLADLSVHLIDPNGERPPRRLTFRVNLMWRALNPQTPDGPSCMHFSPDGRWLVIGARSGTLHRWDLNAGKDAATSWAGHSKGVSRISFDPVGGLCGTIGGEQIAKAWDMEAGWKELEFARSPMTECSLIPPHSMVMRFGDGPARELGALGACDLPGGIRWVTGPFGQFPPSPDGRAMLVHAGRAHKLSDRLTGLDLGELPPVRDQEALAWSPDGRRLAMLPDGGRPLRLVDVSTIRVEVSVPGPRGRNAVAFDPSGRLLAALAEDEVRLHDVGGGEVLRAVGSHCAPVQAVAFTADGALACHADSESPVGHSETTVWRPPFARPLPDSHARHERPPQEWDLSRLLAAGPEGGLMHLSRKQLVVWDEAGGVRALDGAYLPGAVCWHGGTAWAVQGETLLASRVPASFRQTYANPIWEAQRGNTGFRSVAAGPGVVLAGRRDGQVLLFNAEGKFVRSVQACASPVNAIAVNADGRLALVGSEAGTVKLLRLPSCEKGMELRQHDAHVTGTAFAGDRLAVSSRDGMFRLYAPDGELVFSWRSPSPIVGLASSADGRWVAMACEGDRSARVWDVEALSSRLRELGLPFPGSFGPASEPRHAPPGEGGLLEERFDGVFAHKKGESRVREIDRWREESLTCPATLRWTGWLRAPEGGTREIRIWCDGGARVWLDGRLIIDAWRSRGGGEAVTLVSGRSQALKVECRGGSLARYASLRWRRKGEGWQVVPARCLFADESSAEKGRPGGGNDVRLVASGEVFASGVTAVPGGAFTCGRFKGEADFGVGKLTAEGTTDGFLLKHGASGEVLWARRIGASGGESEACAVASDGAGGVYVCGTIAGKGAFVARFDTAGHTLWTRAVGPARGEWWRSMAKAVLPGSGGIYVTGRFGGIALFGPGTRHSSRGSHDLFLWKLTEKGETVWAHRAGHNEACGHGLAFHPDGDVVVAGSAAGEGRIDSSMGSGTLFTSAGKSVKGVAMKIGPRGEPRWARVLGDPAARVELHGVACDAAGRVYTSGRISADPSLRHLDLSGATGAHRLAVSQQEGAWAGGLDAEGGLLWARSLGEGDLFNRNNLRLGADGDLSLTIQSRRLEELPAWMPGASRVLLGEGEGHVLRLSRDGRLLGAGRVSALPGALPVALALSSAGEELVFGNVAGGEAGRRVYLWRRAPE